MAKRRRLSPANPDFIVSAEAPEAGPFPAAPAGNLRRPPVADLAGVASAHSALDEMVTAFDQARSEGRMVLELPLDAIQSDYLVRDRIGFDEEEMQALVESLRSRGQQTPVEVTDLGEGRYGLISGWRRCRALKRLLDETGEDRFARVRALMRRPEVSSDAYIAMVEENEIRVGLSYYERARIAAKAADQGVFGSEQDALRGLFASASRAKRSKIGSFIGIVRALDGVLAFPEALPERAGLVLAKRLAEEPALADRLRERWAEAAPADPETEQARIRTELAQKQLSGPTPGTGDAPEAGKIVMKPEPDGSLRLVGAGLDAAFCKRLEAWLKRDRSRNRSE